MSCAPEWYVAGEACPYGHKMAFSITVPNDPNFWQLTSITYGLLPWILCMMLGLLFLVYRGTRELAVLILPGITVGLNEFIKHFVQQSRPLGSCLTSCGMPSSHSAVAMCLLIYLILDAAYRIDGRRGRPDTLLPTLESVKDTVIKLVKGLLMLPFGSISQNEFTVYLTIWITALLPIPLSRVILNDHTASQAFAGCIVGLVLAFLWFPIVLGFRIATEQYVGRKFGYIFVHNYDVPLVWKADVDADAASKDPLVPPVADLTNVEEGTLA